MPDGEVAALVAAAREGDDAAWAGLVSRYVDLVWSIARGHSLTDCDAADVSQTTWMRLYEQITNISEPSRVGAWLATTARRESLRIARERRRQFPSPMGELVSERATSASTLPSPEEVTSEEQDARFWEAVGALSQPCQVLLRALAVDPPPSYAVLSQMLAMPVGSIGPTRARCLERLKANILSLSARPSRPTGQPAVEPEEEVS